MSRFSLSPPSVAEALVRKLLSSANGSLELSVREDQCFDAGRLSLGHVDFPVEDAGEAFDLLSPLVSYEWHLPEYDTLRKLLAERLQIEAAPRQERQAAVDKDMSRVGRILDLLACVPIKLGIVYPRLDADMMASLPFRRPVTIVTDTSAIAQGALDFVARHLHPAARVKIPAVAHMEIVNQADRFLSQRRATKRNTSSTLYERASSQGAQRVLLRLEFHTEVEIERTAVLSEPLRSAFTQDKDIPEGNLAAPVRSFCDRLILEVARQHQAYAAPGHQTFLLTSDQGLARMAMAEGISPMFYMVPGATEAFGSVLTGTVFDPFADALHHVSIVKVLWELAASFGNARLTHPANGSFVEVATIGEGLTWSPFHSREDLLWVAHADSGIPEGGTPADVDPKPEATAVTTKEVAKKTRSLRAGVETESEVPKRKGPTSWRFATDLLLEIVATLGDTGRANKSIPQLASLSDKTHDEYRRLLYSGGFLEEAPGSWVPTTLMVQFRESLLASDLKAATQLACAMPSFAHFLEVLTRERVLRAETTSFPTRALSSYETLAEVLCAGASIATEGFFATPNDPPAEEFAPIALERFEVLARGDSLVSVGAWLEDIIRKDGIHPVNARSRLSEAWSAGQIVVVAEGSTTDLRHESRTLRVLHVERDQLQVRLVHLYRGDFLIPNRSSTSFRIEKVST